ncbi:MAG: flavin reductase family protein [Sedimentisphaerales bacterium]|nr:flavin reductase family protein [Sedimentisphaerales bacterium]
MGKVTIDYRDYFAETIQQMCTQGLLLVSADKDKKPNVMAIGWGMIGSIWSRPAFIVFVRPSRHTYGLLEEVGEFTVNVPPNELAEATTYCGTVSGRDHDKIKEKQFTLVPGRKVRVPIIQECIIHYECRLLHKNNVLADFLDKNFKSEVYPKGDFHRIYFGEILTAYADDEAVKELG